MSAAIPSSKPPQKTRKEREKEREKERKLSQPQPNERLKTVVRRLPPNLPEDIFWQSVQPWVTEETTIWKVYYPGKLRKRLNKENVPSRAYVAFKNEEQLALFSREYDGHVFRDKTGVESQAVVEFAPYPKIPSEKRKPDNRNATIEQDDDYISFVESLKAAANAAPVTLESLIASTQTAPPPKTTPLLEALKAEKSANKDKEAILRNHAHYNQTNSGILRKEDKKKAGLPSQPQASKASDAAVTGGSNGLGTSGKKAGKKGQNQAQAPAVPAQKPAQANSSNSATTTNPANNVTASQPPKPTRAPRAPRVPSQPKVLASTTAALDPSTVGASLTLQHDASSPPVRRTRPVIGLASRQFEAALSGVAPASERRARREKEAQNTANNPSPGPAVDVSAPLSNLTARIDGSDQDRPSAPSSPKKERTRRGGGGRGGGGGGPGPGGVVPTGAPSIKGPNKVSAAAAVPKVPSILQRVDGPPPGVLAVQRDTSVATSAPTIGTPSVHQNHLPPIASSSIGGSGAGGRGGRRGRGAPRGRGATPAVAARIGG
ncbi:Smg-4/UPF3 family-domain-containing protein [Crassisporium funariophilum]|nr:Smg-4/UPF3 family-domain-containing protein [Crassisporium funariophilum]